MLDYSFEARFFQLGKCVNELKHLFDTCMQDYNEKKIRDANIISKHIQRTEELFNTTSLRNSSPINSLHKPLKISNKKGKHFVTKVNSPNEEKGSGNSSEQAVSEKIFNENEIKTEIFDKTINSEFTNYNILEGLKRQVPDIINELNFIEANTQQPLEGDQNTNLNNNILNTPVNPIDKFPLLDKIPKILKKNKKKSKTPSTTTSTNTNTIASQYRKFREAVFSTFTKEEKERILYDKNVLGIRITERKWGLDISNVMQYTKQEKLFTINNEKEKNLWMDSQKVVIENYMRKLDKNIVLKNIEGKLRNNVTPISLSELCNLSFDRGLARAGAMFSINLFELEFFLINTFSTEWEIMEHNKWFCLPEENNEAFMMGKLDIVQLSYTHGIIYASKKSGREIELVHEMRKVYETLGASGLAESEKFKKKPKCFQGPCKVGGKDNVVDINKSLANILFNTLTTK